MVGSFQNSSSPESNVLPPPRSFPVPPPVWSWWWPPSLLSRGWGGPLWCAWLRASTRPGPPCPGPRTEPLWGARRSRRAWPSGSRMEATPLAAPSCCPPQGGAQGTPSPAMWATLLSAARWARVWAASSAPSDRAGEDTGSATGGRPEEKHGAKYATF